MKKQHIKHINKGITIWRFKTIKPKCDYIGIVDIKNIVKNTVNCDEMDNCYLLNVYDGTLIENTKRGKTNKNWKFGQIKDDVLCIMYDYDNKTLSFSFNNKPFQTLFKNINTKNQYKIAISMYQHSQTELSASTHF